MDLRGTVNYALHYSTPQIHLFKCLLQDSQFFFQTQEGSKHLLVELSVDKGLVMNYNKTAIVLRSHEVTHYGIAQVRH